MEIKLGHCNSLVAQLGDGRETEGEQRGYIASVTTRLRRLIEAALDGDYHKADFVDFVKEANVSQAKKLRDLITCDSEDFASDLRLNGRLFNVVEDSSTNDVGYAIMRDGASIEFDPPYSSANGMQQLNVSLDHYCRKLATYMKSTRGKTPKGLLSQSTFQAIFRQQSAPWEKIVRDYVEQCRQSAYECLQLAVSHVAGRHTGEQLMQKYINPAFDNKATALDDKITELLRPYQKSHPITYNPMMIDVGSSNHEPEEREAYAKAHSWTKDIFLAAQALDRTEAYYEIALDTLVDNVATLAVESCLLTDLPDLIAPEVVSSLNLTELAGLAAEPKEAQEERARAKAQRAALKDVIQTCSLHADRRARPTSFSATINVKDSTGHDFSNATSTPSFEANTVRAKYRDRSDVNRPLPGSSNSAFGSTAPGLFANGPCEPIETPKTVPSAGTGIFGSSKTPKAASSAGTSIFGSSKTPEAAPSTGTGLFGSFRTGEAAPSAGTGLFGSSKAHEAAPGAGSRLFGSSKTPEAAPSASTGIFGSSKPHEAGPSKAFGTLGSSSPFGNLNNANNTTGPFGALPKPTTNIFDGSRDSKSLFGAPPATSTSRNSSGFADGFGKAEQGTGGLHFFPYVEKNSAIGGFDHHHSLCFEPPTKGLSFEELRLADYAAGHASDGYGYAVTDAFAALGRKDYGALARISARMKGDFQGSREIRVINPLDAAKELDASTCSDSVQ